MNTHEMNAIDAFYLVKYNPFKYGKYLADFYSELTGVEKNSLLLPILIPLFTHPFFKDKIEKSIQNNLSKNEKMVILRLEISDRAKSV